jgi:hypothetical protein
MFREEFGGGNTLLMQAYACANIEEEPFLKLNSRVNHAADPALAGVSPTITRVIAKSAAQLGI